MEAFEPWSDASSHVFFGSLLGCMKDERLDAHGLFLIISYLAQTSRGVALAWRRIEEAKRRIRATDDSSSWFDPLDLVHETHVLVVAAHAFWTALDELRKHLELYGDRLPALADSTPYQAVSRSTREARHHLEHHVERIKSGRERPRSSPMSKEVFRQAPAQVHNGFLRCGNERFDLAEIAAAVDAASRTVGEEVAHALQPQFSAEVLPPLNAPPPA